MRNLLNNSLVVMRRLRSFWNGLLARARNEQVTGIFFAKQSHERLGFARMMFLALVLDAMLF
jgi:hypothetical protein